MTTLKITNEDENATVEVLVFDNGNPAGDPARIPPGESRAVYVTPTRKLVVTQSGVDALRGVPVEKVPAGAEKPAPNANAPSPPAFPPPSPEPDPEFGVGEPKRPRR
jgi:hypothetical protein